MNQLVQWEDTDFSGPVTLSTPQAIFLNQLDTKFRGFIGGFGSGKTLVGCFDLLQFAGKNPGVVQGYFGPTYPSIRDIFFPTFEEAAHMLGFTVVTREINKEVHIYRNGFYYGTVICRSMEKPASIVGFKIARALVDEIDTLPIDKATQAWNKIIARLRLVVPGIVNGIGVTTTPEGFRFVYSRFADNPTISYSMVQSSTRENEQFLPPDYIASLYETYPDNLIKAYIDGDFVNLTSGSVYLHYNRVTNSTDEKIQDGEPLYLGMDFNVQKMAAAVNIKRGKAYHCVDEMIDGVDTPGMVEAIKSRYPEHQINVYPDASGRGTSSKSASKSDIGILEQAGFTVHAHKTNPRVKDRVLAVNRAFERKQWHVCPKRAPTIAKNLEQQPYNAVGEPDKANNQDHSNDAFGYPVAYLMPVVKPSLDAFRLKL